MTGPNSTRRFNLFYYYLFSLITLVVAGLVYKTLFVLYDDALRSGLKTGEIIYALFWGMRFDLASAAVFSLLSCILLWLFFRLQRVSKIASSNVVTHVPRRLLLFMLFLQVTLQVGDTLYYADSGRHVSYEMRDVFTDVSGLFMTAVSHHALFIVLAYLLALVLAVLVSKLSKLLPVGTSVSISRKGVGSKWSRGLEFIGILLLSLVLVRGGVTGLPQSVISAFKIGDAKQAVVSMNGAYSVVYGALNSSKEVRQLAVSLPPDIDVDAVMKSLYPQLPDFDVVADRPLNRYNLIFILMEGWPADVMSDYGYEKDTTPFFASLKARAYAPLGVVAGGNRTTEGIYATFCSQQNPLGSTVAQSSLQNNHYRCLPDILKQNGWHTAFFQGTHKETSGTGAFAQSLGFSESFAREDMPDGRYPLNYWGAQDPDIYDYVLSKLDQMPRPFLVGVNTNSTHDIQLPAGEPYVFGTANREQKYISVLHFADSAMAEFFEKIKNKPYYDDTIFILMSDHTTGGKRSSVAAKYFIPGIIYSEQHVPAKQFRRYISQRDFAPTVLDIIGLPASPSFAGKSFWQQGSHAGSAADMDTYFADYFDAGTVGWLEKDLLVETSIDDITRMKCYRVSVSLASASPAECDHRYQENAIKSLVFTDYSQSLLFSGRTEAFYDFAKQ